MPKSLLTNIVIDPVTEVYVIVSTKFLLMQLDIEEPLRFCLDVHVDNVLQKQVPSLVQVTDRIPDHHVVSIELPAGNCFCGMLAVCLWGSLFDLDVIPIISKGQ